MRERFIINNHILTGVSALALMLATGVPAYAADGAKASANAEVSGNTATDNGSLRENLIDNAWNGGATGIVHNQQNNGSNNAVNAATAVHADVTGGTDLETGATVDARLGKVIFVGNERDIDGNSSIHTGAHTPDRSNSILDTMLGFFGVATLQQNNGDNNALNAATAVDGVDGDIGTVDQNTDTEVAVIGQTAADNGSRRQNLIDPSFTSAAGVVTVQQNNGDGNAISAATAVAGVTGDASLIKQRASTRFPRNSFGAPLAFNQTIDIGSVRSNLVENSFQEFKGAATVQQNNGNANVMSTAIGVTYVHGNSGNVEQESEVGTAFGGGFVTVSDHTTESAGSARDNSILASFSAAKGLANVQQNNGDANGVTLATNVAAVRRESGNISQQSDGTGFETGNTTGNLTRDTGSLRNNLIDGSFGSAQGVFSVQQNNGDANDLSSQANVAFAESVRDIGQSPGRQKSSSNRQDTMDVGSQRNNSVTNSFGSGTGLASIQQNNGDANDLVSASALAAAYGAENILQSGGILGGIVSGSSLRTEDSTRENRITNSFNQWSGVATVQQNNGDGNAIGAVSNIVGVLGGVGTIRQRGFDTSGSKSITSEDLRGRRINTIDPSFTNAVGLITVQQNTGNGNAVLSGKSATVALMSEGDVMQQQTSGTRPGDFSELPGNVVDRNNVTDTESDRLNTITDLSFENAAGVVSVQQNNGDGNVMSTSADVVAIVNGAAGAVSQTFDTFNFVEKSTSVSNNSKRVNTIDQQAFKNVMGVVVVQQNNGSNNVITSSNAAVASGGIPGFGPAETADSLSSEVTGNSSTVNGVTADGTPWTNTVTNAFAGAAGVMAVQQNNGDTNAMGSVITIVTNGIDFGLVN